MNIACFFAYGTLLNEEVWHRVAGASRPSIAGRCQGFAAYQVRAGDYPGLLASDDQQLVSGRVYLDIDDEMFGRLDTYEGNQYTRQVLAVECADGESRQCWAYLWKPELSHLLTTTPWGERQTLARPIEHMPIK